MQYNTVQPESKQDWIKAQSGDTQRRFGDITRWHSRWHWGTDMRDPHDMGLTCQWLNVIVQCYWISIKNMHALLHDQSTGKNRSDDSLVLARFWQQPWAIILTTLSWFMTHGLDYSRQICWVALLLHWRPAGHSGTSGGTERVLNLFGRAKPDPWRHFLVGFLLYLPARVHKTKTNSGFMSSRLPIICLTAVSWILLGKVAKVRSKITLDLTTSYYTYAYSTSSTRRTWPLLKYWSLKYWSGSKWSHMMLYNSFNKGSYKLWTEYS